MQASVERGRPRFAVPAPAATAPPILRENRPSTGDDEESRAEHLHKRPPAHAKIMADDFDDLIVVVIELLRRFDHDTASAALWIAAMIFG